MALIFYFIFITFYNAIFSDILNGIENTPTILRIDNVLNINDVSSNNPFMYR